MSTPQHYIIKMEFLQAHADIYKILCMCLHLLKIVYIRNYQWALSNSMLYSYAHREYVWILLQVW